MITTNTVHLSSYSLSSTQRKEKYLFFVFICDAPLSLAVSLLGSSAVSRKQLWSTILAGIDGVTVTRHCYDWLISDHTLLFVVLIPSLK